MASVSDHIRRDGEHAARSLIRIELSRYTRRMDELAKAHVKEVIEDATTSGREIDGLEVGRTAADLAIAAYIGSHGPSTAVESTAVETLPAGD